MLKQLFCSRARPEAIECERMENDDRFLSDSTVETSTLCFRYVEKIVEVPQAAAEFANRDAELLVLELSL